jgi:hypothetical protein
MESTKLSDVSYDVDTMYVTKEVIKKLIGIFEIMDLKDADIDKELAIISYLEEKKELNSIYKEYDFEKNRVIDDYHSGYIQLINNMEDPAMKHLSTVNKRWRKFR